MLKHNYVLLFDYLPVLILLFFFIGRTFFLKTKNPLNFIFSVPITFVKIMLLFVAVGFLAGCSSDPLPTASGPAWQLNTSQWKATAQDFKNLNKDIQD